MTLVPGGIIELCEEEDDKDETYTCDWCEEKFTHEPYMAWDWSVCRGCFNGVQEP